MHLHASDVLEKVFDTPGTVPCAPGALEGQQREELTAVGLVAVDLSGRARTGGRTVKHGAPVVVKANDQQDENLPKATYRQGATQAECAK